MVGRCGTFSPCLQRTSWCIVDRSFVWTFSEEALDFVTDKSVEKWLVVDQFRPTFGAVSELMSFHERCVVLISLLENVDIFDEGLLPGQDPPDPGQPRLEEPDELVEVVAGNVLRPGQDEHSVPVSGGQGLERSPVLARRDGEVGVGVGEDRVPLHDLVDDDERGTAGHRGGHSGHGHQQQEQRLH